MGITIKKKRKKIEKKILEAKKKRHETIRSCYPRGEFRALKGGKKKKK